VAARERSSTAASLCLRVLRSPPGVLPPRELAEFELSASAGCGGFPARAPEGEESLGCIMLNRAARSTLLFLAARAAAAVASVAAAVAAAAAVVAAVAAAVAPFAAVAAPLTTSAPVCVAKRARRR